VASHKIMSVSYANLGMWEEATEELHQARRVDASTKIEWPVAQLYLKKGNAGEAIKLLDPLRRAAMNRQTPAELYVARLTADLGESNCMAGQSASCQILLLESIALAEKLDKKNPVRLAGYLERYSKHFPDEARADAILARKIRDVTEKHRPRGY